MSDLDRSIEAELLPEPVRHLCNRGTKVSERLVHNLIEHLFRARQPKHAFNLGPLVIRNICGMNVADCQQAGKSNSAQGFHNLLHRFMPNSVIVPTRFDKAELAESEINEVGRMCQSGRDNSAVRLRIYR